MTKFGLIREGKIPGDSRVAFTPQQCRWLQEHKSVRVVVQSSPDRCFSDSEYRNAGIEVRENLEDCDIFFGIKEVPSSMLIPNKTYLFFSHTKKLQEYNQAMFQSILRKKITLIDYECLTHDDGNRVLGFGFFAGVVGAHNGINAFRVRNRLNPMPRLHEFRSLQSVLPVYQAHPLPPVRIVVTGSGRVAAGIRQVLEWLNVKEVSPSAFLNQEINDAPVYVNLYGESLYQHKQTGAYRREDFHQNPQNYVCLFPKYIDRADVLMNGIYWNEQIPRLFEMKDFYQPEFQIETIADVTDDVAGSVPCNLGDATIEDPVYGVSKSSGEKTQPYLPESVDVMAVGNLPNELPVEASEYFGEQLIAHLVDDLLQGHSAMLDRATLVHRGTLTEPFSYMKEYARTPTKGLDSNLSKVR